MPGPPCWASPSWRLDAWGWLTLLRPMESRPQPQTVLPKLPHPVLSPGDPPIHTHTHSSCWGARNSGGAHPGARLTLFPKEGWLGGPCPQHPNAPPPGQATSAGSRTHPLAFSPSVVPTTLSQAQVRPLNRQSHAAAPHRPVPRACQAAALAPREGLQPGLVHAGGPLGASLQVSKPRAPVQGLGHGASELRQDAAPPKSRVPTRFTPSHH